MSESLQDVSDAKALPMDNEPMALDRRDTTDDDRPTMFNGKPKGKGGNSDDISTLPSNAEIEEDPETPYDNLPPSSISESSSGDGMRVGEEEEDTTAPEPSITTTTINIMQRSGCEFSSVVVQSMDNLPPLPKPRHDMLREETSRGLCAVITAVVLSVLLTHYIALTLILPSSLDDFESGNEFEETDANGPYKVGRIVFLSLVYTESVLALVCMTGILCVDPCVVKRSEEACNPLPLAVESWVLSSPSDPRPSGLENYLQGPDKRIYCTKCLVWRNAGNGVSHYHCAICQRCCAYHDHHCNVFGRCIAGKTRFWKTGNSSSISGNILYFYGLLTAGGWAFSTVFAAFLYAFSMRYGTKHALPIGFLITLLVSCCFFGNSPIYIVCWPFFRVLQWIKNYVLRRQPRR